LDPRPWLVLARIPGVGPVRAARLLEIFGGPAEILAAPADALAAAGLKPEAVAWLHAPDPSLIESDLAWTALPGNHLLYLGGPGYPDLLARIPDPPPVLFLRGEPTTLDLPLFAVVGSRNPTEPGRRTARAFARHLAAAGLGIVSGLALGVDAAAHEGALETGVTLAVAGTGPDRVYPAHNRELAQAILRRGAILTEFPPGTPVRRGHFPRRNRIISGLSLGVLVVEAAERSGSLITARLGAEQGREVFAIPGSIHNPLARGCHRLIREGAKLVETAGDILEELPALLSRPPDEAAAGPPAAEPQSDDPEYRRLLECLGHDPQDLDLLTRCTGLGAGVVSSMLLMLELEGRVVPLAGGRYCLTGPPFPS